LLEPFILRRSKSDVAPELPSLTEEVLYCGMTEQQEELYKDERNRLRSILLHELEVESEKRNFTIINGIMRLRQLACHPRLTLKDFREESGKMEEIVGTFETLRSEGHKVLIFSSFVQHLELVAKAFTKRKWKYAMLTGSTTNREEEITRFADDENIQAFLISLKAGGVGLNLTQADYIFIIDPWWNPAAEMQAIGRAHRIGQQKQVMAYRFITQDSIEEKMMQLQAEKRKLAESFITDNNPLDSLTDSEWEMLLT
jgi:SNF2 family DNA or RNA helicase